MGSFPARRGHPRASATHCRRSRVIIRRPLAARPGDRHQRARPPILKTRDTLNDLYAKSAPASRRQDEHQHRARRLLIFVRRRPRSTESAIRLFFFVYVSLVQLRVLLAHTLREQLDVVVGAAMHHRGATAEATAAAGYSRKPVGRVGQPEGRDPRIPSDDRGDQEHVDAREHAKGGVYEQGAVRRNPSSSGETLKARPLRGAPTCSGRGSSCAPRRLPPAGRPRSRSHARRRRPRRSLRRHQRDAGAHFGDADRREDDVVTRFAGAIEGPHKEGEHGLRRTARSRTRAPPTPRRSFRTRRRNRLSRGETGRRSPVSPSAPSVAPRCENTAAAARGRSRRSATKRPIAELMPRSTSSVAIVITPRAKVNSPIAADSARPRKILRIAVSTPLTSCPEGKGRAPADALLVHRDGISETAFSSRVRRAFRVPYGVASMHDLLILCYHAVDPAWPAELSVTTEAFSGKNG